MPVVTAKVWDSTFGTELATLQAKDMGWTDQANDVGSGQLSLRMDDPDVEHLAYDNIVQFLLDGEPAFAWVIEARDQHTIAPGEAAEQRVMVSGRGLLSLLDRARVLPLLGIGRMSPSVRRFDWTAPDLDDSAWDAAVEIKRQGDTGGPADGFPKNWPAEAADAYMIWGQAPVAGPPPQPPGDCLFRGDYTLSELTTVTIFVTGDDGWELIVDGARLGGDTQQFAWKQTAKVTLTQDGGDHWIDIRGTNLDRPSASTNVAWVICAVMETDGGGNVTDPTPILVTDDSWRTLAYPATTPGMTPGLIYSTLQTEEQTAGGLIGWTKDYSDDLDSDATPWTELAFGAQVGQDTYLDVNAKLCETHVDVDMAADGITHHAWAKPHGEDLSDEISFEPEPVGDVPKLTDLAHEGRPATATGALMQYADGRWAYFERGTAVTAYGRKVAFIQSGTAGTASRAEEIAEALFDEQAEPSSGAKVSLARTSSAVPYQDFGKFDTIAIPGEDLTPTPVRVHTITVVTDDAARAIFALEFFAKPRRTIEDGGGLSGGGTSGADASGMANSSPLDGPPPDVTVERGGVGGGGFAVVFHSGGALAVSASDELPVPHAGTISKFRARLKVAASSGTTTVDIYKNASDLLGTVSLGSGAQDDTVDLTDPVSLDGSTDYLWVDTTAVGTGAEGLVIAGEVV